MIQAERTGGRPEESGISIRVAIYPESGEPEVTEVAAANPRAATVKFCRLIMEQTQDKIPEEAVREVVENLVHAGYRGVVISVLDGGKVVRVSDKGPGIREKSRAMEFGFSGATPEVLRGIRGVGAGLGIARAAAEKVGGTVTVEDNIGGGTVVSISMADENESPERKSDLKSDLEPPTTEARPRRYPDVVPRIHLSERQQKVLMTVLEYGEVGPSTVAEELEMSVSTAYRDLSALEEDGLIVATESGKRTISPMGRDLAEAIIGDWVR